ALGLGVAAVYLWCLASLAATAVGTTMLGFRTEPVLILLLVAAGVFALADLAGLVVRATGRQRSEEHTSELQSRFDLVCRLLLVNLPLSATTTLSPYTTLFRSGSRPGRGGRVPVVPGLPGGDGRRHHHAGLPHGAGPHPAPGGGRRVRPRRPRGPGRPGHGASEIGRAHV